MNDMIIVRLLDEPLKGKRPNERASFPSAQALLEQLGVMEGISQRASNWPDDPDEPQAVVHQSLASLKARLSLLSNESPNRADRLKAF
jgi:hypothetical protein